MASSQDMLKIYVSLRSALARAVMGIVPPKEIEDIVQETYVRVCQRKRDAEIGSPRSFLFRTARNLALDYVKRAESRLAVSVEDTPENGFGEGVSDGVFDDVASKEEFARFCEAVRQLPPQCRRAFVLKKVYGYSQRDIAREMNISENTVEKHVAHGIRSCARTMRNYDKHSCSGTWAEADERNSDEKPPRQGSRR